MKANNRHSSSPQTLRTLRVNFYSAKAKSTGKAKKMKKLMALLLAGTLFLIGCAHQQNLTKEEKEAYRKANMRYEAGQRGGP